MNSPLDDIAIYESDKPPSTGSSILIGVGLVAIPLAGHFTTQLRHPDQSTNVGLIMTCIVIVIFLVYFYFRRIVLQIIVEPQDGILTIESTSHFGREKTSTIYFGQLTFSFKNVPAKFRSPRRSRLVFYREAKKISEVESRADGWTEDTLKEAVAKLLLCGVKQTTNT